MSSTYSPTLRIELIGDGDQSGIWGQTTNNNLGGLLEQAITGVVTIAMTDANYTLTSYNGVVDEARNAVIVATGTNSAQRNIVAPLVEKIYTIKNSTTGGYAIQIIGATGTGVVIPNGTTASVYCDGTNFYPLQVNTVGNQTINGNLVVTGTTNLQGALTATTATFSGAISSVNPVFTGTPTAPTAPAGTSTTQLATTAFVSNFAGTLGTMATQNANNVNITGGTVTGLTNLATTTFSASSAAVSGAVSAASATISGAVSASSLAGGASTGSGASGTWNININGNAATASFLSGGWAAMPAGTRVMFAQSAAPTGWTQVTGDEANNRMLRVVNTAGAGTGGSASPILNNVVPSHTHSFSVTSASGGVDHTHGISGSGTTSGQSNGHTHGYSGNTGTQSADHAHYTSGTTGTMNSNWSHAHSVYDPGHTHAYDRSVAGGGWAAGGGANNNFASYGTSASGTGIGINATDINHTHNWGNWSGGVNTNHTHAFSGNTGDISAGHTHTWSFAGSSAGASAYAHTHGVSGTTDNGSSQTNWTPRYIDMILCSKN